MTSSPENYANASLLGPLCAFLSCVTWTTAVSVYSSLSKHYPAFSINFGRAFVSFPLFLILTLLIEGPHSFAAAKSSHIGWISVSVIASYALGDVFFLWSTRALGVPGALAIASTFPLWSALAGWVFRGEVLDPPKISGLVTIVLGTALVILTGYKLRPPKTSGKSLLHHYPIGVLLAILTSILWAINPFACAQASDGLSVWVLSTIRAAISMALCPLIAIITDRGHLRFIDGKQLFRVLWIFALEGFGGSLLYMYGISNSRVAVAAALSSLSPVVSVPVAWMKGSEQPAILRTMGILLVVAGIWLLIGIKTY